MHCVALRWCVLQEQVDQYSLQGGGASGASGVDANGDVSMGGSAASSSSTSACFRVKSTHYFTSRDAEIATREGL